MADPKDLQGETESRVERQQAPPRRAGLRRDERDPEAPPGPPGSGAGDIYAAGTPGGGLAAGGLAGSNLGDDSPDDVDLNDAFGSGLEDREKESNDLKQQPEPELETGTPLRELTRDASDSSPDQSDREEES